MKSIVFDLGPAVGLTSRGLVIYNVGVHPRTTLYDQSLGASAETATVELAEGLLCQAILTDVKGGQTSTHRPLSFSTGRQEWPGPSNVPHGETLRIIVMDDMSSSSSSSSLSSSSSSSSSLSSSSSSSSSISTSSSSSSSSSLSSSSSSSSSP